MTKNPLLRLQEYGQSVWLDSLSRKRLRTKQLTRLIDEDGLSGVTSNPTIFEMGKLANVGIAIDEMTRTLEEEGVDKFVKSFEKLFRELAERTSRIAMS